MQTEELSAIISPLGKSSPKTKVSKEQLSISRRKLSYGLSPVPELFKSPSQVLISTPKITKKPHECMK